MTLQDTLHSGAAPTAPRAFPANANEECVCHSNIVLNIGVPDILFAVEHVPILLFVLELEVEMMKLMRMVLMVAV